MKILDKMLVVSVAFLILAIFTNIIPQKEPIILSEKIEETQVVQNLTLDDFSLINLDTNEKISLSMTKEEVEGKWGNPTKINTREYSELKEYEYDGLFVIYRNNKVVNLRVNKNVSNNPFRFATIRGVAIGDNTDDILMYYNDFNIGESWIGCAVYDGESGLVVSDEKGSERYEPEKVYLIYFAKNMSGNIYLITIMDYKNKATYN